jgi:uncharacterized Zn finger protein
MMKVLAAEMSDPSRLRRGKQYAHDGSVLDIVIEPGVVTCEIQGSRSTPYIASVEVTAGDGMPLRRDVTTRCTCPDDDNWDGYACKHVVAAMFALSDEFLLEPALLDIWRGRTAPDAELDPETDDVGDRDDTGVAAEGSSRSRRHLRLVADEPTAPRRSGGERLEPWLRIPEGATLPEIAPLDTIDPEVPGSRELAAVLRDAWANLRIRWD